MSENLNEDLNEDFLSVDTPIPGQNYTCLSFVSPEKELANKNIFMMHHFLKSFSEKYNTSENELLEKYKDFKYLNEEKLEKKFFEANDFKCSVRGIKVRGTYDTYKEASVRAKLLQRKDTNFHVFVGQVGYWLPWDPTADNIEDQEYQEGQLNKLVKKYQENTKKRDEFYEHEKIKSLEKIKEENIKKSTETDSNEVSESIITNNNEILETLEDDDPWLKSKVNNGVIDLDK